ncbi:MAG: IS110 family transposase [Gammaproteobacteria bacterium]|nr:IS110 family transposase [Gammaproteobacteria bacterium]
MRYYAGVDVSLRTVNICVIDAEGELVAETKLASDVQDIVAYLDALELDVASVGLEAGTLTQYLTYGLQSTDFDVICMESRQVKGALSAMRNKTDKHDARGLAQILRSGWYSQVHVKSMESHHIRMLLSSRRAVLSKCLDLENEVRGLFKVFGIKLPPKLGHGPFDVTVRDIIEADENLSLALLPLLEARLALYRSFRELDNRTRKMANADPVCQRLMTVPGVGFITALTFKAGVDDPTRFKHSRTVGAHFGLTPRRSQSGEMDNSGHISRAGDADVRCALYTAANAMLTRTAKWSSLKAWGMKIAKTRGHRRAVVAVARKLAVVLHRIWIDDTQFRWGMEGARS